MPEIQNQFDRARVEKLHVESTVEGAEPLTLAAIEEITWELVYNQELKATDFDGDLVTIIKTSTPEGKNIVRYDRRSNRTDNDGKDDGKYSFTLELEEPVESEE